MQNSISMENTTSASLAVRLWRYQRERFPLGKHGMVIAAFSFSAVTLSALLRGVAVWPTWQSVLTAFLTLLGFFFQLRVADEYKDWAVDARYRPERPVPRGLVTLTELRNVALVIALLQILAALWLDSLLLVPLGGVWLYMALMRVEFGIGPWLQRWPLAYLISHMVVVPLIDLYATACDWLPHQGTLQHGTPLGLGWFLAVSFFNGIVIEIGRKTWAPAQEREGVESYSSSWGICRALLLWSTALFAALVCALVLAGRIGFFWPLLGMLSGAAALLIWLGACFVANPTGAGAERLETVSGLWVAGLYVMFGIVPMGVQLWI
ncbi:MAG TPA: UbiA family prenyltransferase [Caldilineaceae bacterium]|nr:UbiA family prenyltransferase [Caldilineaceae bacterium]